MMEKPTKKQVLIESWPAALSALLYVLIFPKAALSPLAFVFIVPVLWAASREGISLKRVFWLFWFAGILGHIGKMYWLVYTMNHYGFIPMPLAIFVLLLLTGTLGAFWGLAGLLAFWIRRNTKAPFFLIFPASWMVFEWVLTWFLTGFPWDMIGNSLIHILPLVQFADVVGMFGISFFAMVGNAALFELLLLAKKERKTFPVVPVTLFVALFVFLLVYGLVRIPMIEKQMAQGKSIRVGLLQGNVDQLEKWGTENKKKIMNKYHDLAKKATDDGAEILIFPETALPYWQYDNRPLEKRIREFATENDRYALIGYPLKDTSTKQVVKGRYNRYNVASLVNPEGEVMGTVKKHRLVPFGEYLPVAPVVLWLKDAVGLKKARVSAGFQPADKFNTLAIGSGRFGVAICYEVIFPGLVRTVSNLGTDFLVTITNDGWFGNTSAPFQHVDQVAMRSVEMRRSFARAANTGISCVVDPTGKVRSATKPYTTTFVVDDIKTMKINTIYAKIGNLIVYIALIFLGIYALMAYRARRVEKGVEDA